jgi:hypothetical protein
MAEPSIGNKDVAEHVRNVTDEEVDFYRENGWVMIRQLIPGVVARTLLEAGKDLKRRTLELANADTQTGSGSNAIVGGSRRYFRTKLGYSDLTEYPDGSVNLIMSEVEEEPFRAFKYSKQIGWLAAKLINRSRLTDEETPINFFRDAVLYKSPGKECALNSTGFHQDSGGLDRPGTLNVWMALDEVAPEQGAMRFLSGSHREGCLAYNFDGGSINCLLPIIIRLEMQ